MPKLANGHGNVSEMKDLLYSMGQDLGKNERDFANASDRSTFPDRF